MFLFNRMMNRDKRYRYWLKYFQVFLAISMRIPHLLIDFNSFSIQMPIKRSPDDLQLVGYSKEQLKRFWKLSSSLQNIFLKSLLVQAIITMSLPAILYGIIMQRHSYRHSPIVFWTILIVSRRLVFVALGELCKL